MEAFSLPWGYKLTLYENDGMSGNSIDFYGGQNTDDNEFMDCIDLPSGWRNKATSYSIQKYKDIGPARVFWHQFTATEGIDVEVHYGFESNDTETKTEEQEATLTYELGIGIGFGEDSLSENLTETFREMTSTSTSHSMTYSFDVTYKVSCTEKSGTEGVGLFQQVTEGTDGKARVWSTKTLCRYGDLWNTKPECPYEACADAECTTCKDGWKQA